MQGKREEIQGYLAKNINVFVKPMIYEMVKKRPADPEAYALKWLQDRIRTLYSIQKRGTKTQCTPAPNAATMKSNATRNSSTRGKVPPGSAPEMAFLRRSSETSTGRTQSNSEWSPSPLTPNSSSLGSSRAPFYSQASTKKMSKWSSTRWRRGLLKAASM